MGDYEGKAGVVSDFCVIGLKGHLFNERNKESQTKQLHCRQRPRVANSVYTKRANPESARKNQAWHAAVRAIKENNFNTYVQIQKQWWIWRKQDEINTPSRVYISHDYGRDTQIPRKTESQRLQHHNCQTNNVHAEFIYGPREALKMKSCADKVHLNRKESSLATCCSIQVK